jgi:hypothetical protein
MVEMCSERVAMMAASRIVGMIACLFALNGFTARADVTDPPDATDATGDRPTPAQTELMQGVNERRHEAAAEKADNQHQAEMKKCDGLVWEEAKLCKDQVSTETAQTQAKVEKDQAKEASAPSP